MKCNENEKQRKQTANGWKRKGKEKQMEGNAKGWKRKGKGQQVTEQQWS